MADRRKPPMQLNTLTLGMVVVCLGLFAFLPMDTSFFPQLENLGVGDEWGFMLMGSGTMFSASCIGSRPLLRWLANAAVIVVCAWTFILFVTAGVLTPMVAACGVIACGTAAGLVKNAFSGKRMRESIANDSTRRYG